MYQKNSNRYIRNTKLIFIKNKIYNENMSTQNVYKGYPISRL